MASHTSGGLVKFSIALPSALKDELQDLAIRRRISANAVIVDFIERGKADWLEEQDFLRERRGAAPVERLGAA